MSHLMISYGWSRIFQLPPKNSERMLLKMVETKSLPKWPRPPRMSLKMLPIGSARTAPLPPAEPATETSLLLDRFAAYLASERGLAPTTVALNVRLARPFLQQRAQERDGRLFAFLESVGWIFEDELAIDNGTDAAQGPRAFRG